MGDSDSSRSEKNNFKKRGRRVADDLSSECSYERKKKKKHRHKGYKQKSKKKSKDSTRKHKKRSDALVENDNDVSVSCKLPLPSTESSSIERNKESKQIQQEQLCKQEQARRMAPMSREEYQAQQSTIREVYDEQTGRYRLVRGTGEIIESLVSRSQHENINRQATRGDGASFSRDVYRAAHR
ncbi:hypothetical protein FisN_16Hu290 [Fistulifera solaris]|jgi:hypothetical protein|uniref:ADP-ribosylation factor-like protein 6-interacting protein 4 n=1 Tax=Fistulifera solaris TaxID=1519565 RepID=A0A1Z5KSI4_FISSO|nr:hypothetical protein FisN_16Hu290 [Fistulifera solaris]|eukprot:GAX29280.1 hypothetical protein FisN_16Hu290 [Fistulifera solaris]